MSTQESTPQNLYDLAEQLGAALRAGKLLLAVAESCTGGWIGKAVTDVPGSSKWFDRGFVTYSNTAKAELLDVPESILAEQGAVSGETVAAMATGALAHSRASITVAVSGIAGPDGGSSDKPVGTVYFAWALRDGPLCVEHHCFDGDREAVRQQTVAFALQGLLDVLAQ